MSGHARLALVAQVTQVTATVEIKIHIHTQYVCVGGSYLPVLVSTIMALAQHLKEASTVPMATDSVGSRVRWVMRRSSSNICLWNMAASASRAICFEEKRKSTTIT